MQRIHTGAAAVKHTHNTAPCKPAHTGPAVHLVIQSFSALLMSNDATAAATPKLRGPNQPITCTSHHSPTCWASRTGHPFSWLLVSHPTHHTPWVLLLQVRTEIWNLKSIQLPGPHSAGSVWGLLCGDQLPSPPQPDTRTCQISPVCWPPAADPFPLDEAEAQHGSCAPYGPGRSAPSGHDAGDPHDEATTRHVATCSRCPPADHLRRTKARPARPSRV